MNSLFALCELCERELVCACGVEANCVCVCTALISILGHPNILILYVRFCDVAVAGAIREYTPWWCKTKYKFTERTFILLSAGVVNHCIR